MLYVKEICFFHFLTKYFFFPIRSVVKGKALKHLEHIKLLYRQYLAHTLTESSKKELSEFFKTATDEELDYVVGQLHLEEQIEEGKLEQYDPRTEEVLSLIRRRSLPNKNAILSIPVRKYLTVAAALITFAFIGYYLYKSFNPVSEEQRLTSIYGDDVAPGGNRATITLSDGTVIELSADQDGVIASGSGLSYSDGEKLMDASKEIQYATLNTPRGGQYRLTLPDGSKVILNAESSVRYPTAFTEKERKVELEGEAFFDVKENKAHPFVVATDKQQVTVTGTTFNVNAYGDNNRTITTLVTGSVNVTSKTNSVTATLKPGQEATLSNGNIKTKEVDTHVATGWADGVFVFKYKTLAEILPQLERWYDIKVDINPIPNEEFYSEINRNMPLSAVLKAIEKTSDVRFEIKERRLTLKKK